MAGMALAHPGVLKRLGVLLVAVLLAAGAILLLGGDRVSLSLGGARVAVVPAWLATALQRQIERRLPQHTAACFFIRRAEDGRIPRSADARLAPLGHTQNRSDCREKSSRLPDCFGLHNPV